MERNKWEAREERIVSELSTLNVEVNKLRAEARTSMVVVTSEVGTPTTTESGVPTTASNEPIVSTSSVTTTADVATTTSTATIGGSAVTASSSSPAGTTETPPSTSSSTIATTASIARGSIITSSTSTLPSTSVGGSEASPKAPETLLSMLTAHHLPPPLTKFSGEASTDGETFVEWLEQFEMVASLLRWNDQAKLVNLVTRLKGPASSFYRSCTPEQRAKYALLIKELSKKFHPRSY